MGGAATGGSAARATSWARDTARSVLSRAGRISAPGGGSVSRGVSDGAEKSRLAGERSCIVRGGDPVGGAGAGLSSPAGYTAFVCASEPGASGAAYQSGGGAHHHGREANAPSAADANGWSNADLAANTNTDGRSDAYSSTDADALIDPYSLADGACEAELAAIVNADAVMLLLFAYEMA